jgi:hypothetical protein
VPEDVNFFCREAGDRQRKPKVRHPDHGESVLRGLKDEGVRGRIEELRLSLELHPLEAPEAKPTQAEPTGSRIVVIDLS